jgi:uncharacterized membrane protein YfcA
MEELIKTLLVGFIIFCTHCLEGITGFGCTVLALPFVVLLLGIKTAVPVLVVLAWILAAYIIIRSHPHIKWQEYLFILVHVGLGLPLGIFMFDKCSPHTLKSILAVFMIFVGIHGFIKTRASKDALLNGNAVHIAKKTLWMRGMLFLGGIIHGAFGTGGPFVVIYASKALVNKALFRVTLCLLWLTLNTVMIFKWTISGQVWTHHVGSYVIGALPFSVGGMLLGDYLHHKVNEYYFKITVYFVLLASGLVMGWTAIS